MKKVIRLTESDLHRIIKESVKRVLKEDTTFDNHIADKIFDDMVQKGLYRRMDNQMYVDWIMNSYGLKENQRNVAEMVADKLDVYRMSMEDQYGHTESLVGEAYEWWDEETFNPNYPGEEFEDNYDDDPLDNWKRRKEDGEI
jgi:hypothetical protein